MANNRRSSPRRWSQFSLRALLLLVLVVALLLWWFQPERLDRDYFPIAVGDKWVYASIGGDAPEDVVFEVVGTEQVGDADCYVVLRTIGDHRIRFYVTATGHGVWIHRIGDDRFNPPFQQFAFGTVAGDVWDWKGSIGQQPDEYHSKNLGLQEVAVPLGRYEGFAVGQSSRSRATYWLVDGIGVVRLQGKTTDEHDPLPRPGDPLLFDWQLKEFSRP